jgi:nucleoside-diphosphate-sugar epimerase
MNSAIVTGATGFIGSVFVDFLIKNHISVLALGRKDFASLSDNCKMQLRGAEYLKLEMENIHKLGEVLENRGWQVGEDCVFFNLSWGGIHNLSDMDVEAQLNNVIWSVNALAAASEVGCKKFIQVGTMEEAFTYKYFELNHHLHSNYNRHVIYSSAKIAAKYALTIKAAELGIQFIYVLHSHVMGPEDSKDSFLQVTLKKLIDKEELIFSSGEQLFDVISLQDCVLGYYLICKKGKSGSEYWVGSGQPKRLREYVEIMYNLYPSGRAMQFGKLPYNDITLTEQDFSIENLTVDTGYIPLMTYEETVHQLYDSLIK